MAWIWPNLDDHSKTKAQTFCTYLTMSLYADPTICNPVVTVGYLLNARQFHSEVNP